MEFEKRSTRILHLWALDVARAFLSQAPIPFMALEDLKGHEGRWRVSVEIVSMAEPRSLAFLCINPAMISMIFKRLSRKSELHSKCN